MECPSDSLPAFLICFWSLVHYPRGFSRISMNFISPSVSVSTVMASQRGIGLRWNLLAFCKQRIAVSLLAITGHRHRPATCRVVACQTCARGNKASENASGARTLVWWLMRLRTGVMIDCASGLRLGNMVEPTWSNMEGNTNFDQHWQAWSLVVHLVS